MNVLHGEYIGVFIGDCHLVAIADYVIWFRRGPLEVLNFVN